MQRSIGTVNYIVLPLLRRGATLHPIRNATSPYARSFPEAGHLSRRQTLPIRTPLTHLPLVSHLAASHFARGHLSCRQKLPFATPNSPHSIIYYHKIYLTNVSFYDIKTSVAQRYTYMLKCCTIFRTAHGRKNSNSPFHDNSKSPPKAGHPPTLHTFLPSGKSPAVKKRILRSAPCFPPASDT